MNRLAEFRRRAGKTQKQVAAEAGCSEQLVTALETGRRRLPNVYIAQRIARAVGAPVEEVFPLEEAEESA